MVRYKDIAVVVTDIKSDGRFDVTIATYEKEEDVKKDIHTLLEEEPSTLSRALISKEELDFYKENYTVIENNNLNKEEL